VRSLGEAVLWLNTCPGPMQEGLQQRIPRVGRPSVPWHGNQEWAQLVSGVESVRELTGGLNFRNFTMTVRDGDGSNRSEIKWGGGRGSQTASGLEQRGLRRGARKERKRRSECS
jgi:hypothetical protein